MIFEVEGDILLSQAEWIAHGVAPGDHFTQGLALALREQWPSLSKDFRHYCQSSHPQPGGLWMWHGPGVHIANLLTQESAYDHGSKPGQARLEFVGHALRQLAGELEREKVASIALPKLATGVGRLDWNEVRPLVEKHLGSLQTRVILYTTYRKDVRAQEPVGVGSHD
ncbi:MAG: Appr-1-p processing protein [Candidatus Eremiobacteraeota bacterium]|nr:Appr-1-p processing protein [Candidatus Eremiobacteraeota bacterium]